MYPNTTIMFSLNYNTVLHDQYDNVEKSKRKVGWWEYLSNIISADTIFKKLNNAILIPQLITSKGLLAEMQEKIPQFREDQLDFSELISAAEKLITLNISFYSKIEKYHTDYASQDTNQICISESVLKETIEVLYDIVRLLKKTNKRTSLSISEETKIAAKLSAYSLEKILHGN